MDWRTLARCKNQTKRFYPEDVNSKIVAKSLCRVCPVQRSCLAEALTRPDEQGIWGGRDEKERRVMVTILQSSGLRVDLSHDMPTLARHG